MGNGDERKEDEEAGDCGKDDGDGDRVDDCCVEDDEKRERVLEGGIPAFSWKAAKDSSSVGFTANTIPDWQSLVKSHD